MQTSPADKNLSSLLTASGVPNKQGRLLWPMGLRILAAPEAGEMRERIDALFQEAASQAAGGPVSSALIQETNQALEKFRKLLLKDKAERLGMPLAVYNESERFLNRLQNAAQLLEPGLQIPEVQDQPRTTAPSSSNPLQSRPNAAHSSLDSLEPPG
jgi:hypothetical protein